jgi:pimeloyl-ACP methyl ester carboxylesterase
MKKFLRIIATLTAFMWIWGLALFISSDPQIFNLSEQEKIKKEKLFWEWPSPHGPVLMHYLEKGKGDQHILFLHGFRSHTYTWRFLIDPLVKAGYHVWAVDLIGYGLSEKPSEAPYTIDFFVQQIEDFMAAQGISSAHLVGNSMGGGLALNIALSYPSRVQSLVLISALGYPLDLPLYLSLARQLYHLWTPFLSPFMIRNSLKWLVYDSSRISEEQVDAYHLPYRFPGGVNSTILTLRQFDNQFLIDMSQRYNALEQPMLLIWGNEDRLIPVSHYEKFIKDFPSAECLLLPKCGHIPQEEEPQKIIQALLSFFQSKSTLTKQ